MSINPNEPSSTSSSPTGTNTSNSPSVETGQNGITEYPVEFRGNGGEYFKIWIVNILLTIVTLYIYSAWAKVRSRRYFYGNTFVDNSAFEYHAQPRQILLGRMLALVALIFITFGSALHTAVAIGGYILLALVFPWIIWRSIKFNGRMSSYRNVPFGFTDGAAKLYLYLVMWALVPLLAGGAAAAYGYLNGYESDDWIEWALIAAIVAGVVIYPVVHRMMSYYALNGHRYGTAKFKAELRTSRFYLAYFGTILLYVAMFVLAGLFVAGLAHLFNAIDIGDIFREGTDVDTDSWNIPVLAGLGVLAYIFILVASFIPVAYWRATLRNYRLNNTQIGDRVALKSTVPTMGLFGLMFGNAFLIGSSFGLAYPWTRIRILEFFAKHTKVVVKGTLDGFVAAEEENVSALGEEFGDAFDMDMDLGL